MASKKELKALVDDLRRENEAVGRDRSYLEETNTRITNEMAEMREGKQKPIYRTIQIKNPDGMVMTHTFMCRDAVVPTSALTWMTETLAEFLSVQAYPGAIVEVRF
jgi:hypothetical protein